MKPIDLGSKPEKMSSPVAVDSSPKKYYPGVYLTLPAGTKLPTSGEVCFKYKLASLKADLKNGCVCVDMELMALTEVETETELELPTAEQAMEAYAESEEGEED